MENKIKTIFMGTPELAAVGLQALIDDGHFDVKLVITQADKAVGRNLKINKPAVKILAEKNNIKVIQPLKIKEVTEIIEEIAPDLIVVIAYGKIIPKNILESPKYGCINVHGSLLPKYRGSACIQATILNGDSQGGITIMKMDETMDTGDIIKKISVNLEKEETSYSLMEKIKKISQENLTQTILDFIEGKIKSEKQNNSLATYVKMIKKEDGHLKFDESAEIIERKIRAYFPWPGTFAFIEKEALPKKEILFKILKAGEIVDKNEKLENGQLVKIDKKIGISCQDKILIIEQLQLEGKKASSSEDFLKGNSWVLGKVLK
ncbi:MAG: methionyl-tRNA formyltransferase [Patescibacteria group bacterium]|nr:methionyl-tRNA formyltransferase [Patescibacteria group bacterium]